MRLTESQVAEAVASKFLSAARKLKILFEFGKSRNCFPIIWPIVACLVMSRSGVAPFPFDLVSYTKGLNLSPFLMGLQHILWVILIRPADLGMASLLPPGSTGLSFRYVNTINRTFTGYWANGSSRLNASVRLRTVSVSLTSVATRSRMIVCVCC